MSGPIDFAEIEDVKENVQPLRSGRNPKDLAKQVKGLKAQPLSSTVSLFQAASEEWEEKLSTYSSEDELEVWDEYIKWAQQHATSDKLAEKVIGLLQRCTRKFQANEQYKDDPRYLRIWIKYIDTVNDPADIFQFLEANNIGTGLALFYTSWALVLELKKSMYAEAYQKLDQGLSRKAHPVEKLQMALKDFQHRMNQRTIETMKNAVVESKPSDNEELKRGREFGDQINKKREVSRPAPAVSSASSISGTTVRPRALGGNTAASRAVPVQATGNKAGFAIFCDDGTTDVSAPGGFAHLASEKEKSKENTRAATKWTAEEAGTIPQKRAAPRPVAAAPAAAKAGVDFELFVDDELAMKQDKHDKASATTHTKNPIRLQVEGRAERELAEHVRQQRPLEFLAQAPADDAVQQEQESEDFHRPPSKIKAPAEGGAGKGALAAGRVSVAAGASKTQQRIDAASRSQQRVEGAKRPRVDPEKRNKSEDGTGLAAYDRSMLRLDDGEEICPEEARALARYGIKALQGSLVFDAHVQHTGPAELAGKKMTSPSLSRTEDEEGKGDASSFSSPSSDAEAGDTPNETQPSPTFSSFAPKHQRRAAGGGVQLAARTPLLLQLVLEDEGARAANNTSNSISSASSVKHVAASDTYTTHAAPAAAAAAAAATDTHSNSKRADAAFGSALTLGGGGEDCHALGGNLGFRNASELKDDMKPGAATPHHTAAATPHHTHKAAEFLDNVPPTVTKFGGYCDISMISKGANSTFFANSSRTTLCPSAEPNFSAVSPECSGGDTQRGDDDGFFKKERYISQRDDGERAGDEHDDGGFFKRVVSSPTIMTKHAAEQAFDLMPSPTLTCMPSQQHSPRFDKTQPRQHAQDGDDVHSFFKRASVSPTMMTKRACEQTLDLMPSPTQTGMPLLGKLQGLQALGDNPHPADARGHTHAACDLRSLVFDENSAGAVARGAAAQEACLTARVSKSRGLRAQTNESVGGGGGGEASKMPQMISKEFFGETVGVPASPTIVTKKAHAQAFDLMPSPTATVMPLLRAVEATQKGDTREAEEKDDASAAVFDLMPSPTVTLMPVARLEFRARRSHGAPSGDTPAKSASGGGGGGFMIREDTSLHDMPAMSVMPASGGGGFMIREDTSFHDMPAIPASGGGGFIIREDTSFQDMPASGGGGGSGGGFMIREDTSFQGFISDVCAQEVALQGLQGTGARTGTNCDGPGANSKSSGAFVMREDTEPRGFAAPPVREAGGLEVREDTGLLAVDVSSRGESAAAGGSGGGGSAFMIREDTNLKGFHLQPEVVARAPASSCGGTEDGLENAATQAKRRGLRVLCDTAAAANGANSAVCLPSCVNDENAAPTSVSSCANNDRGLELEYNGGRRELECNVTPLLSYPHDTEDTEETEENECDAVGGPGEVGTLYPDLNTIVEGSSHDEASRENSKSLVDDGSRETSKSFVCFDTSVSAVGAFGVEKVSMSPLSQAVRDKVQKSMEKSRGSSPPSCHEDANSREFEAAAASEEEFAIGGSGKRKVGQEEEEDAVIEDAVLQYVQSAGSEGHRIEEVLFWKQKPAACDARNSSINSSTDATHDSSTAAALNASGSGGLNSSGNVERSRRARASVCYKELAVNVKCRQGANPWADARDSSSRRSSCEAEQERRRTGSREKTSRSRRSAEASSSRSSFSNGSACFGSEEEAGVDVEDQKEEEGGMLLAASAGSAPGFSREEDARRVRQVNAIVRRAPGYVSRVRESAPTIRVGSTLVLERAKDAECTWRCEAVLGKGNFASVYLLRQIQKGVEEAAGLMERRVLKVLGAPNVWEMHVSSKLKSLLPPQARSSFTSFDSLVALKDGAWLVSKYKGQASLQQAINAYRKANKKMEEAVVMFYAIELIRAVEALHKTGILHGDIKPDNILVRDDDNGEAIAAWTYSPHAGFGSKGIELIDYGCAIDCSMYPVDTAFSGRSNTESFECLEMLCGKTWREQVDLYAVAATVHCLLHQEYMAVEMSTTPEGMTRAEPKLAFKRYWQVELWKEFFDTLLNGHSCSVSPDLASLRGKFETYFASNEGKRSTVRVGLMKQALLLDEFVE